ncbi:CDP-glycerol glycerophosphotransferase family protein [Patescibacteria group bacterium]|nr:CDP-glycerol glycerophosphotransferase family protein [Patescibacteria group bacterium]
MTRFFSILKKATTVANLIISWPLFFLSCLFPRKQSLWVFIGWHRGHEMEVFADNTKYFFLHIRQHVPQIQAVWLAKDEKLASLLRARGYEAYDEHSLKGIWYALRAHITVIDAFLQRENFRWSGRSKIVQLLHGRGMKKKAYGEPQIRQQNHIFSTSIFTQESLSPIFTKGAQLHVTGFSRNDLFFHPVKDSDIGIDHEAKKHLETSRANGKKTILYAPTFRRGQKTADLEKTFDLETLPTWLAARNIELFISLHPKQRDQVRSLRLDHVHFIEDSDIYPLLPNFSGFILDYSSLFSDILLLDRPMIFYPYDLERYEATEGLSFPYGKYIPGPIIYTQKDLLEALERSLTHDTYASERERVRGIYHAYTDGQSSERIMATVLREENIRIY